MSLRRSPERAGAERDWAGFVAANRARLQAAGHLLGDSDRGALGRSAHARSLAQHEDPSGFSIEVFRQAV
jgi:hypothetical protein